MKKHPKSLDGCPTFGVQFSPVERFFHSALATPDYRLHRTSPESASREQTGVT
jgi:hypothetical protein